jgi:hypothetical protein
MKMASLVDQFDSPVCEAALDEGGFCEERAVVWADGTPYCRPHGEELADDIREALAKGSVLPRLRAGFKDGGKA